MVKRWNNLALTIVMVLLGVLLIAGSALASIGTTIFPFDTYVGTDAPVAGATFGAGIILAAWRPDAHVSWVRLAICYCGLDVIYEIVKWVEYGGAAFGLPAFVISIIFAALLIMLYPKRSDLVPRRDGKPVGTAPVGTTTAAGPAGAHA
ncbi:MAG TPA: hypothetical protein VF134_03190 [Candidatus Dormibacteraeota bacterium]